MFVIRVWLKLTLNCLDPIQLNLSPVVWEYKSIFENYIDVTDDNEIIVYLQKQDRNQTGDLGDKSWNRFQTTNLVQGEYDMFYLTILKVADKRMIYSFKATISGEKNAFSFKVTGTFKAVVGCTRAKAAICFKRKTVQKKSQRANATYKMIHNSQSKRLLLAKCQVPQELLRNNARNVAVYGGKISKHKYLKSSCAVLQCDITVKSHILFIHLLPLLFHHYLPL